jgi:miniconductance mechanosensitive channel
LLWLFVVAVNRFIRVINHIYDELPQSKGKPIKGYMQVVEILIYLIGIIIVISIVIERSPWVLLSGLGAISAILLLIFKETILSFVASVRISSNQLIEVGDWVEMPQYDANGEVIDIALHNFQIQNWDKTITSIPTHRLLEESFKNWKGMHRAGGRRIMRNINIDLTSIQFCDEAMLEKFSKIRHLKGYIDSKLKEIEAHNKELGVAEGDKVNGRHLTNIGTFRAYINFYLENHKGINQDLLKMARLMEPGPNGVPLQVYAFTKDTLWLKYEATQSDIFDHLLAIMPEFGLRVFQQPSGNDLSKLARR